MLIFWIKIKILKLKRYWWVKISIAAAIPMQSLKSCLFLEETDYGKKEKMFQNKQFIEKNAKELIFTAIIRKEEELQWALCS